MEQGGSQFSWLPVASLICMNINLNTIFKTLWSQFANAVLMMIHATFFFLHCLLFQDERHILLSTVKNNESKLLGYSDLRLSQILHSGDTSLDVFSNSSTLNVTIDFVICSKRLEELFYTVNFLFSTVTIFYQNLFCIILTFILIFVRTLYLCLFFNFNFLVFTFFGLFFD